MCFSQVKRKELREKHPNESVGEIAKILGSKWKQLSEEERVPFDDMAKVERDRYDQEMDAYRQSRTGGVTSSAKRPAKKAAAAPQKRGRKPKKAAIVEEIEEEDEEEEEEEEEEDEDSSSD